MAFSTNQQPCYESPEPNATAHIGIVTPAPPGSRRGNRVTAERWASILRELGHLVDVLEQYADESFDALIVLHAGRGAGSVRGFRARHPDRPLVVAITGTDLYGDQFDAAEVLFSLTAADRIVVLQPRTADDVPSQLRSKVRVVYQSAKPPTRRDCPRPYLFEVAVVGHLRAVKDPFRASEASGMLPANSTVRIIHLGAALSPDMAEQAHREAATNWRYTWLGDLPHDDALSILARCRLLAVTSLSEGGPSVIAEAIVAGVPVLATRVAGCVGMLGGQYPGLFAPGDTQALAELLLRAERDATFYQCLQTACDSRRPLFQPEAEVDKWRDLLAELGMGRSPVGA
jgi:putative glycosyltransferase (TIGR04348 family)